MRAFRRATRPTPAPSRLRQKSYERKPLARADLSPSRSRGSHLLHPLPGWSQSRPPSRHLPPSPLRGIDAPQPDLSALNPLERAQARRIEKVGKEGSIAHRHHITTTIGCYLVTSRLALYHRTLRDR